jgi:peptidyl-prolyl cis-trans isomerase D
MTMLDRMRRHKNWLKWSLVLVVLAFIALYIPASNDPANGAGLNQAVATVEGSEVTVAEFRQAYARQMQQYRSAYGANMDERLLRQLGVDQRIVQQLIEEEISVAEARRLGVTASDEEVKQRILLIPSFQENGQFIGYDRYRQMLQMQNPPIRESDFEEQVRRSITMEKLQAALTNWISISDADVEAAFKKRNEKVKLAVVNFPADKFRESAQATDQEVAAWFESHKDQYKIPEKRKIKYALLDVQTLRERITVTPEDVQRHYEDNAQQYSTPEQVRASHILLKTEGKNEADVKKLADELAAKAKAGADFAALAKQYSEDDSNNTKGGDLDFFGKGQMVPEFDAVAFNLKPGEVSDAFKTSFGYHVVKLVEKRAASTRPLAEVRAQIEDQIKWQRAQDQAQRTADDIASKLKTPADLDAVARPRGLTVAESGFFAREEPIAGLGMAPAAAEQAFSLKDGEVSPSIRTPQGFAFVTVTGKQDAYVPKLDEVKARVRDDVLKQKAVETAQQRAAEIAAKLKSGNFEAEAKTAGLEVKTTDLIARGAPIGDAGVSPAVDAVAFSLPAGAVSDPITTDNGAVVVKVLEKKEPTAAEIAAGKQQTKDELMNERRGRFYAAYMTKARERMNVRINNQLLAQLTQGS